MSKAGLIVWNNFGGNKMWSRWVNEDEIHFVVRELNLYSAVKFRLTVTVLNIECLFDIKQYDFKTRSEAFAAAREFEILNNPKK